MRTVSFWIPIHYHLSQWKIHETILTLNDYKSSWRSLLWWQTNWLKRIAHSEICCQMFFGAWGARCNRWVRASCTNATICPHYLPIVLQIAPIDYVTTCPCKYYMYIYIDTSRPELPLNILYWSSAMFKPTSLLHHYIDQVQNVHDLVIPKN